MSKFFGEFKFRQTIKTSAAAWIGAVVGAYLAKNPDMIPVEVANKSVEVMAAVSGVVIDVVYYVVFVRFIPGLKKEN